MKYVMKIKQRIRDAQYVALKTVNKELIDLYWDIGESISMRQEVQGWGKSVVDRLATDLEIELPGVGGFSTSNLWRMKKFFETYSSFENLAPLVREIGWSHNVVIIERCKNSLEREYYIRMVRTFGWSRNILIHQIENQSYEKSLMGQTTFDKTLYPTLRDQAKLAFKDDYTFEFLELDTVHSERELKRALLRKIEDFLRSLGGYFAFIGSQYRLEVSDKEYFIDLLLFHRRLKCLVAIDLKIGEFRPEYFGKMQFYLAALDQQVREEDENPSIGIILCKEKDRMIVEYALRDTIKPIGVATYRTVKSLPQELTREIPSPDEIRRLLESIE